MQAVIGFGVPRETDTELQAAARAIFRRLPVKILRQVLADVGLEAVVCVEKNDCMDALLALPPTKLAGIIEGSTAVGSAAEAAAVAATAAATGGGGSSSNDGSLHGSTEAAAARAAAEVEVAATEAAAAAAAAPAGAAVTSAPNDSASGSNGAAVGSGKAGLSILAATSAKTNRAGLGRWAGAGPAGAPGAPPPRLLLRLRLMQRRGTPRRQKKRPGQSSTCRPRSFLGSTTGPNLARRDHKNRVSLENPRQVTQHSCAAGPLRAAAAAAAAAAATAVPAVLFFGLAGNPRVLSTPSHACSSLLDARLEVLHPESIAIYFAYL